MSAVKRYALIGSKGSRWDEQRVVAKYLPDNYSIEAVVHDVEIDDFPYPQAIIVSGRDVAGWTLDGYVLPRLASGLIRGIEIDLSHPVMKRVPMSYERRDELVTEALGIAPGETLKIDIKEEA